MLVSFTAVKNKMQVAKASEQLDKYHLADYSLSDTGQVMFTHGQTIQTVYFHCSGHEKIARDKLPN